jgi:phage-related protein
MLPASFYVSGSGASPVLDWLKSLPENDRKAVGYDITTVEFGWPVGMPLCRSMGNGLWEIRSTLSGNRIARVIIATTSDRLVLLHGFIKKTQQTPPKELQLALKRWKEIKV